MNKYLSKIVGAVASLALVIGVGVGVASKKNVKSVDAAIGDTVELSFSLTANPGGWPTTNSTTETPYVYSLSSTDYIFTTKNIKCNSGYLMCTSPAALGLPKFSNKKLITVVAHNSGSCSTTTKVGISSSSSSASYISGGATKTWSTTDSNYTYDLSGTSAGTRYYLYITNKNAQVTSLTLTYEITSDNPEYYVSYNANGGTGAAIIDDGNPYGSGTSVTVKANPFTKTGYIFDHWDTAEDGSGADYDPGDTFSISGNTTLYAQWVELPYTVTYSSNGATSGSVPTDDSTYAANASVTVKGNTGSLVKTGYIWSGWNTEADGTGTTYATGSTFNITAATTLYARWINDYSSADTQIVTASYLNLDSTGITSAAILTASDGMQYSAAPGGANSVKATSTTGSNKFNSDDSILMGKNGAYLYNNDPFQKNIARVELFSNTNASASVNVAVAFGTSACTESYTTGNINFGTDNAVYTFKSSVANTRFFRVQITNGYNTQIQIRVVFEKPTTSISISPESVTLAPTETQQLSATVLPSGATDEIVYSSNDEDVATVSEDGLITAVAVGTATITATSGSYSDTCEVTVEIPVVPFVTLDSDSTSGYTGQSDTIPFLYGNLTGVLNVAVQNANATALIKNDDDDGYAEVQVSFVNAGSCEVYVKDGLTTLATITATITASTVTVTGLPTAEVMANDRRLDLGELITVTALGSFSNDVTWSSSTPSVATVDSSGVVSSIAIGSTTITVTPDDYPAGAVSCNITVANIVHSTFVAGTDTSDTTSLAKSSVTISVASGEGTFSRNDNYRVYSGKNVTIASSKGSIVKISVSCTSSGYNRLTGSGYTKSGQNGTWVGDAASVTLSSSGGQTQINKIVVTIKSAATGDISNITTSSALSYTDYNDEGDGSFTFTNLAVRLGGLVSKTLWDKLGAETEIQGYGVIFSTDAFLDTDTIRDYYNIYKTSDNTVDEALAEFCDGTNIINYSNAATNHEPALKTTPSLVGDNYRWNLYLSVPVANRTDVLVAVAYIKIDGDILFLRETRVSASSLADDLIESGEYEENAFGGSLKYLAGRP